jgi:lipopolysaccharide export system permease protein
MLNIFKKLDRYVISEFWLPLVSGAGIITGVWLGIDKFKEVFKLLAKSGASYSNALVILGLEIPQILSITLPVSILLASFLAFQKLSGHSELIAMRAAGASFGRIMRPVIYMGMFCMLACFAISEYLVPFTGPLAKKVYTIALYNDPMPEQSLYSFSYLEKDSKDIIKRIFYVKHIKDDILKNVVIVDFSDNKLLQIYLAKEATWDPRKGGWSLLNGSSSYIKREIGDKDASQSKHLISNFQKTFIPSGLNPRKILKKISHVREMNFMELAAYIKTHEEGNIETDTLSRAKTSFHSKFAYPVSCIFLAIIGACLGITARRAVINWGYVMLGLIVFIFYMSQSTFDSFGDSGRIEPFISMWIPNLILGSIALTIYLYKARS